MATSLSPDYVFGTDATASIPIETQNALCAQCIKLRTELQTACPLNAQPLPLEDPKVPQQYMINVLLLEKIYDRINSESNQKTAIRNTILGIVGIGVSALLTWISTKFS